MLQSIQLLTLFSLLFCELFGGFRIVLGLDQGFSDFSPGEHPRSFHNSFHDSFHDSGVGFPEALNNMKNVKAAGFFIPPEALIPMGHLTFQQSTFMKAPRDLIAFIGGSLTTYRNQQHDDQYQPQNLRPQEILNKAAIMSQPRYIIKSFTQVQDVLASRAENLAEYLASDKSVSSSSIPEKKVSDSTASEEKSKKKVLQGRIKIEKKIRFDSEKNRPKSTAKPTLSEIRKDFYQRSKISVWNNRMPTIGKKKVIGHIRWELTSTLPFVYQITKAKLMAKDGRVTELPMAERSKSDGEGLNFETVDAISKSDRLLMSIEVDGQTTDIEFEIEELDETF